MLSMLRPIVPVAAMPMPVAKALSLANATPTKTQCIEVLCAKPGPGTLAADGREVPIKGAKPLPSSD